MHSTCHSSEQEWYCLHAEVRAGNKQKVLDTGSMFRYISCFNGSTAGEKWRLREQTGNRAYEGSNCLPTKYQNRCRAILPCDPTFFHPPGECFEVPRKPKL